MTSAAPGAAALDPVFVICNGRSGSTLLRFLLDAHPQLACPPETNLPALAVQLATVWSLIEGAPLSENRGDEPPEIPEAAIVGVRHAMDEMIGSYLGRRGKQRYCDKSLGTARFAELLVRVYPQARFVCLYRHPMDVIASGIEACPWGLSGYGFDHYIAETPGNAVLALARFWADNAGAVAAVEEQYPGHCHRVRYEDLVADPEQTASALFEFLGVAPAPGITSTCFSGERERFGPGDYKIWRTSKITGDSVGRGWSVPAGMIAPLILNRINELAGKLGYVPVDDAWGTSGPPADLRLAAAVPEPSAAAENPAAAENLAAGEPAADGDRVLRQAASTAEWRSGLGPSLRAALDSVTADLRARWVPHAAETFVAVAAPGRSGEETEYWQVDLKAGVVTPAGREAQDKSDWDVVASADTWRKIISRDLNLNVALRSCQLRYCDESDSGAVTADTRLSILAALLGIGVW